MFSSVFSASHDSGCAAPLNSFFFLLRNWGVWYRDGLTVQCLVDNMLAGLAGWILTI